MKKVWTEKEDNYILNNYGKKTWYEMASFLGCAINTVQKRAEKLGIEFEYKEIKRWTDEEINLLREYSKKYVTKTIAKKLGKTVKSVQHKALKEGIKLHNSMEIWKPWMINYLKDNINKKSIRQISIFIGISERRIRTKCKELNLEYDSTMFKKLWTKEEEQVLIDNYKRCHYSELTKLLPNKSKSAILCKARDMNLDIIIEGTKFNYNYEHEAFIKKNWGKIPINEMARQLGVSRSTINKYKSILELPNIGQKIKWDEKSLARLERLAKKKTISELAVIFKTTNGGISSIASKNGIKLIDGKYKWSEETIEEIRKLAADHTVNEICTIIGIDRGALARIMKRNKIVAKRDIGNNWTDDEINYLLNNKRYNLVLDIPTMMKSIDKTDESIIKKCKELDIKYLPFSRKEWTDDELKNLIEDAKTMNIKELVIKYNRSSISIGLKLSDNKVRAVSIIDHWKYEELELLKELVSDNLSINEIASKLNRTPAAIENKIKRENLDYAEVKRWTKEEEYLLEQMWNEYNINIISKKLNRSKSAIRNKANSMGLTKQFLHQDALKIEEIAEIFNVSRHEIEITWIILGLPYKEERLSKYSSYKYVEIDDLFLFLENNQFLYDGKDFEENILGIEPNWVKEKRKHDTFYGFEYDRTSLIKKKLLQQKKYYLELKKEQIEEQKVLKKEL